MSDKESKALDLDELFGQARAVKVKWLEKEYELLRMEGISPRQGVLFNQLHLRAGKLQNSLKAEKGDSLSDATASEVEEVFDQMLRILNKDLPLDGMPFMAKSRIMVFYMEQTQGKKAMETALKQVTGAKPSAA